jgi:uncharacterized RDD family membrane protein YckC
MQGDRISFARASGRHFGKIISGCLIGIGYIMAGFTEQKQALHDMMAGCLVVRRSPAKQIYAAAPAGPGQFSGMRQS